MSKKEGAGGVANALTGLAMHPITYALYGSTSNTNTTKPGWLVGVDANTGLVTPIGRFGSKGSSTLSDITFAPDGTLYGWHAADHHQPCTVNLPTGAASFFGPFLEEFGGSALANRASDGEG